MKQSISVARPNLISLGTCFGRFSKSGKFKLAVTSLDYLAKYAKFKVRRPLFPPFWGCSLPSSPVWSLRKSRASGRIQVRDGRVIGGESVSERFRNWPPGRRLVGQWMDCAAIELKSRVPDTLRLKLPCLLAGLDQAQRRAPVPVRQPRRQGPPGPDHRGHARAPGCCRLLDGGRSARVWRHGKEHDGHAKARPDVNHRLPPGVRDRSLPIHYSATVACHL